MQELIIDHIERREPKTPDGQPWYIVHGQNKEKMSSFDTAIETLTRGARIEVDVKVKGQYINITKWTLLEPGPKKADIDIFEGGDLRPHIDNAPYAAIAGALYLGLDAEHQNTPLGRQILNWCSQNLPETPEGRKPENNGINWDWFKETVSVLQEKDKDQYSNKNLVAQLDAISGRTSASLTDAVKAVQAIAPDKLETFFKGLQTARDFTEI